MEVINFMFIQLSVNAQKDPLSSVIAKSAFR